MSTTIVRSQWFVNPLPNQTWTASLAAHVWFCRRFKNHWLTQGTNLLRVLGVNDIIITNININSTAFPTKSDMFTIILWKTYYQSINITRMLTPCTPGPSVLANSTNLLDSCLELIIPIPTSIYNPSWKSMVLESSAKTAQAWFGRRFENHWLRVQTCLEWRHHRTWDVPPVTHATLMEGGLRARAEGFTP